MEAESDIPVHVTVHVRVRIGMRSHWDGRRVVGGLVGGAQVSHARRMVREQLSYFSRVLLLFSSCSGYGKKFPRYYTVPVCPAQL